jgi:hypothetical protein
VRRSRHRVVAQIVVACSALAASGTACDEVGAPADGALPRSPGTTLEAPRRVRCDERISGGVVREYARWQEESVRVGPVWLWPAAGFSEVPPNALAPASKTRRGSRFFPDQLKIQLIVPRGERVVVRLRDPSYAAFFFRTPWRARGLYLTDGDAALVIEGCAAYAYTEYSAGLAVDGAGCLDVEVVGTEGRASRRIPVGIAGCERGLDHP